MTKTKRFLSFVVCLAMIIQMFAFTGIVTAQAQEQEIEIQTQSAETDWFELLSNKGYLAVAGEGSDGTNDGSYGIKVRGNEAKNNNNGGQIYPYLHDVSQVVLQSDNTVDFENDEAAKEVLAALVAGGLSEDNAKKLITYAKIQKKNNSNASNFVTTTNDGAYEKTTRTDGVTQKYVWDAKPFFRNRAADKGGDATYLAQSMNSYGPYMYATESTFNDEPNLTIFIEYFDEGTNSFNFRYRTTASTSGAVTVKKTGTGTWKTAIISVTDANISNANSSTGYVHNKDDIRFETNAGAISRFMVVKTSDYLAAQAGTVVPTDFSAFENYGAYIYAGNDNTSDTMSGLNALSYDDASSYDNRIYHIEQDKEYIETTIATDTNLNGSYGYLTALNEEAGSTAYKWISRTVDGAWKYTQVQGKNAYFTTRYVRNRSEEGAKTPAGALYYSVTNDVVNSETPNLTFLVEYFDYDANDISFSYCNTAFANNGTASTSDFNIDRTGTKTWKTGVYHVTDANIDKDWSKTALGNGRASIKIQGPGSDMYISKILVLPTSTYSNIINPPAQEESLEAHNDGINWWSLVKEKGVYVEASNPTANTGMSAMTANRIYDLNNSADVAAIGSQTINGKTVDEIKAAGYAYATLGTADNAANISSATSSDAVYKDTFFTVKNYRNSTSYNVGGNMYFKVTSDKITSSDDDVYVVIEYLDYDPNMSTTQNSNGTFNYKNQSSISPTFAVNEFASKVNCKGFPAFRRHNTNTWKTVAIPVSEAQLTNTNSLTGLVDNTYDIKLSVNNVPTHVSRVGVVKASDVGIGTHTYHAPETPGAGPQIFLAGDSIVEQLDYTTAYPRATIGMELGKYFKHKTISNASSYTYDANDYRVTTTTNEGVTIVNRAKGGKSTRSFLNQVDPPSSDTTTDTRWDDIKALAKKGDYLFVSFCINDVGNRTTVQTNPYLVGDSGDRFSHRANIKEFKDACDELGVNLVLLTPIPGRGLGTGSDAHIASLFAQGRELGIPVLDVHTSYKALVQSFKDANDTGVYATDKTKLLYNYIFDTDINPEYSSYLGLTDDTHVNYTGANEIAKIIIQEIQNKSASYASIAALANWIDTTKSTTTMAAPAHQTADIRYSVSDVKYIVDGIEKEDYHKGEVAVKATITNTGSADDDAVVYVALYDGQGDLADIATSPVTPLAVGETKTVTTTAVTVPDLDGYKLRKFIWNSHQTPYEQDENMIVVTADAGNRSVNLEWSLKKDLGDVTFDIYRDDLLIKSTANGGYVDAGAERGAHTYQVNVVRNGNVIYQSPVAVVNVTNLYEIKQDPDVFYIKAGFNSMNQTAHMKSGITVVSDATPTYPQDAVEAWNLTDADIEASYGTTGHKFQGNPLVVNGGDGSYRVERVTDKYGIEKTAFMSAAMYRPSKKAATQAYLYVDETDTANFTTEDTNITIFIEFLANKAAPTIQYWGSTTAEDGTVSYSLKSIGSKYFSGITGDWRIARYDITDAYFAEDTSLANDCPIRIVSGWGTPSYISSIVMVKGDVATAQAKFAKLGNLEFSEYNVQKATQKYPNGISIDFSSGTPVKDGMDIAYTTSGTGDNLGEVATAEDGVGYYGTKQAIQNDALKGTYLYFKVDKDYILGADGKLVVDITYKADYDAPIKMLVPMYYKESDTASAGNNTVVLTQMKPDSTNNWKTVQCVVDKSNFVHFDNNGAAFRLQTDQSLADADKQLRISSIRIRNIDALPVEIENQAVGSKTTIHIAADSIAANYSADRVAEDGINGWGMVLGDYLEDTITINNKATPGASTSTFANMPSILSSVKEGDYVLISFGHNDQMTGYERYTTVEDYKTNLTNWINQIRAKKGVPVLVTMIPQGNSQTGYLIQSDSFDERRAAVAEVANNTDTMLVKLGEQMFEDETNGVITTEDVKSMYCIENPVNQTHVVESGARYIAQIIVEKLAEASPFFGTFVK